MNYAGWEKEHQARRSEKQEEGKVLSGKRGGSGSGRGEHTNIRKGP